MPVTQKDIAQTLGISRALVGYALNGHPRVSAKTRERVMEVVERTGYQPNSSARALVTGRTYQINLCLPALGSSFYSEIMRQFENLTHQTPYDLVVTTLKGIECRPNSLTGDGTILYGTAILPPQIQPKNVVLIQHRLCGPPLEGMAKFDSVVLDLIEAAQKAMTHLVEQGFKRIAYIAPERMMNKLEPRYAAYSSAVEAVGMEAELIKVPVFAEGRIREQTSQYLAEYFKESGFPDALYCSSDDIAVGAYRTLRELKRRIPDETAVLGVDDINEAQDLTPALTSIHLPLDDICQSAWETLISRIEGSHTEPISKVFTASLAIRESSRHK